MITVIKPKPIPKILMEKGIVENNNNCNLFDVNPVDYNSNKLKFEILSKIYNHPSIKKILRKAQHKKCCFCEKLQHDEYGEVEHYRPKIRI